MYILYYAHDGYAALCAYGVVRMLDMKCCVHMVLCTGCICSAMYIWCCVHVVHVVLYTYGIVCVIVHVVLCTRTVVLYVGGALYMSCMWRHIHVVSCTCRACGVVYIWYCQHVV